MRALQFDQIMRDAEVANAIWPVIVKYHLTMQKTAETLLTCGVPRASNVAAVAWHSFGTVPSVNA